MPPSPPPTAVPPGPSRRSRTSTVNGPRRRPQPADLPGSEVQYPMWFGRRPEPPGNRKRPRSSRPHLAVESPWLVLEAAGAVRVGQDVAPGKMAFEVVVAGERVVVNRDHDVTAAVRGDEVANRNRRVPAAVVRGTCRSDGTESSGQC